MRLKDLEEEAYGPEDYEQIKAKQEMERKDKQKKSDRVKRDTILLSSELTTFALTSALTQWLKLKK